MLEIFLLKLKISIKKYKPIRDFFFFDKKIAINIKTVEQFGT